MTAVIIDYEKEYDNRARVPEHPQIFAAARSETQGLSRGGTARPSSAFPTGPRRGRFIDFFPGASGGDAAARHVHPRRLAGDGADAGDVSAIWRKGLERAWRHRRARRLRSLPRRSRIATIIERCARRRWRCGGAIRKRIFVYGHSAGGHLAACMVATDWSSLASDAPADLVPAAYAISGVYDLAPIAATCRRTRSCGSTRQSARAASPMFWTRAAGAQIRRRGRRDELSEFLRQSRSLAELGQAGAETRYEEIAGANHFTVIAVSPIRKAR